MKKKSLFPIFRLHKPDSSQVQLPENNVSETQPSQELLPRVRRRKKAFSKVIPFHIVCAEFGIAVVLVVALLVLLLAPNDGVPEITVPTIFTESTEGETEGTTEFETEATEPEPTMLPAMAQLYAENSDVIGWITIPDTNVDYPVMYTPEDPQKYIHTNFKGDYNFGGLPFIDAKCSFDPESDNLIFYGHNMNNGTQFQNITQYAYKRFAEGHRLIHFSTLYEERVYEVVAAFRDKVYSPLDDVFKFYQFIDVQNEEEFDEAVAYYLENSLVDFGVTPEYGDNFITLVTCAYHVKNGRFVVVAREVKQETTETTEPNIG